MFELLLVICILGETEMTCTMEPQDRKFSTMEICEKAGRRIQEVHERHPQLMLYQCYSKA